jgi:hypothetical protein
VPSAARLRRPSLQARGPLRCSPPGVERRTRPRMAGIDRWSLPMLGAQTGCARPIALRAMGNPGRLPLLGAAERAADGTGLRLPGTRALCIALVRRDTARLGEGPRRLSSRRGYRPAAHAGVRCFFVARKKRLRQSRARVGGGAPLRGAEKRRARGRAPSARTCSDSSQLSERSERSERSEFCDGPRARASQDRRPSGRPPCQARGRLPGRGFAPRDVDLFTRNRTRIAA